MPLATPVIETTLDHRRPDRQGKVRDIYDFGHQLLIVATDRISAFDYILGSGIPDKGKVLTQISCFWFDRMRAVVPNHIISTDPAAYPAEARPHAAMLRGRSMLVTTTEPLPIECVARGYLSGSGWKDYQATGAVCGVQLPSGLRESDRLPQPIFTPATKATSGHDINISEAEAATLVGHGSARQSEGAHPSHLRRRRRVRREARHHHRRHEIRVRHPARGRPGQPEDRIILIDEVLTPDSSRFWPQDGYKPGGAQPSFDKQFVRDYLESIKWNKQPPVPSLPPDVIAKTRDKYVEAYRRLTGKELL